MTTFTCSPAWLVPAPRALFIAGTKSASCCSTHGNSGAYRARMCSVDRLSADSVIAFAEFASRKAVRSSDEVVRLASNASKFTRWFASVRPVTPKSLSACRMAGAAAVVGPGEGGQLRDVSVDLRQLRVQLLQVGVERDESLAECVTPALQPLRDRGQRHRQLVRLRCGEHRQQVAQYLVKLDGVGGPVLLDDAPAGQPRNGRRRGQDQVHVALAEQASSAASAPRRWRAAWAAGLARWRVQAVRRCRGR